MANELMTKVIELQERCKFLEKESEAISRQSNKVYEINEQLASKNSELHEKNFNLTFALIVSSSLFLAGVIFLIFFK